MGFFDEQPQPPEDLPDEEAWIPPIWHGPPQGWIGGVVPVELALGRSERGAVFLTNLSAFPSGFAFELHALARRGDLLGDAFGWEFLHGRRGEKGDDEPTFMRYGVEFSDGRKATSTSPLYGRLFGSDEELDPSSDIVLIPGGGGSGDNSWHQSCWVWPLPPHGAVNFVCEWLDRGIEETHTEVDSEILSGAAERAVEVWPAAADG